MTVKDYCRNFAPTHQLCVIRDSGWIVETVWIDSEDLFRISELSKKAEVKRTAYEELPVKTEHGDIVHIPCLYIDT